MSSPDELNPSATSAAARRDLWSSSDLATVLQHYAQIDGSKKVFTFLCEDPGRGVSLDDAQQLHRNFAQLDQNARAIAAQLQSNGIRAGERVLLVHPAGLNFIDALFGCFYAGVIAIPTIPPHFKRKSAATDRFELLITESQPSIILTDSTLLESLESVHSEIELADGRTRELPMIATDLIEPSLAGQYHEIARELDAVSILQYTSGSTGSPKGVMLSQRQLMDNLAKIREKFGIDGNTRACFWLPPHHDMGLIGGILETVYSGCFTALMAPSLFLRRPLLWLEGLSHFKATVGGAPNFAYQLCVEKVTEEDIGRLDLSHWEVAFNGAETVLEPTIDRFYELFNRCGFRRQSWMPCYGLAEATLLVTCNDIATPAKVGHFSRRDIEQGQLAAVDPTDETARRLVSSGMVISDHTLVIIDPETTTRSPEGTIGEICLAGASVAGGYWNQEEQTKETFCRLTGMAASSASERMVFLRTGDLGALVGEQLYITSRIKDLIIIRGRNLYPHDLEETVERECNAVQPNGCAAFSIEGSETGEEQLAIACEIRREKRNSIEADQVIRQLRSALATEHQVNATAVILLKPGALARTTSGKIQRHLCRASYRTESWAIIAKNTLPRVAGSVGMDESSSVVLDTIRSISTPLPAKTDLQEYSPSDRLKALTKYLSTLLVKHAQEPQLPDDGSVTLGALGLDSLTRFEVGLQIESDLSITLEIANIDVQMTIQQLAELISDRICTSDQSGLNASRPSPQVDSPSFGEIIPLSPQQSEFLGPELEDVGTFSITAYLRILSGIDFELLEEALTQVFETHQAFALRFDRKDGRWQQTYRPDLARYEFEVRDVSELAPSEWKKAGLAFEKENSKEFDLVSGPLARVVCLDRGPHQRGILMISIHHLVIDGISTTVFLHQLDQAYKSLLRGERATLTRSRQSYSQWAHFQNQQAQSPEVRQQFEFWREDAERMSDQPPENRVKVKGAKTPVEALDEEEDKFSSLLFDTEITEQFKNRFTSAQQQHDVLLAGFLHCWSQLTDRKQIRVRLQYHGRQPQIGSSVQQLTGWLFYQFPLTFEISKSDTPTQCIEQVRQRIKAVPQHGISYGWLRHLCDDEQIRSQMEQWPAADLSFSSLGNLHSMFRARPLFTPLGVAQRGQAWARLFQDQLKLHTEFIDGKLKLLMASRSSRDDTNLRRHLLQQLEKYLLQELSC